MYEYKSCYQAKSNTAACTCKFHGSPVYVSWQEMGEEGRGEGERGVWREGIEHKQNISTHFSEGVPIDTTDVLGTRRGLTKEMVSRNHKAKYGQLAC